MRNNETGEFELVVGNRQLLSGFFIVVLLFAVAFAMGYIFGQNSPRSARLQPEAAAGTAPTPAPETRPQPASPAPTPVSDTAPTPEAGKDAASASDAPAPAPQPTTQPARESPAAAPPAPTPRAPVPAPVPAPAPEAAPGTSWQVMAVNQAEAEVVAKALKDKGFPVSTAPGPNNLTRVLVGPYKDTQSMGRAKTQLEGAGFHPIRK
jgi:cell division septation protein DedD